MDAKRGRFLGEKAQMEVKEEVVEEGDDRCKQEQEEPTSDSEDNMTLDQYLISKKKPIYSSSISDHEVKQSLSSEETYERPLTRSKTRKKRPLSEIGKVIYNSSGSTSSEKFKVPSSSVLDRATEVRANLDPKFPSFVKLMLRSHVTKGFWLGLPSDFCKKHLPRHNDNVILEDENGEAYETKFLGAKIGLSGGWKGFTRAQKLLEGDVVVFHLVGTCKFKVYIVRTTSLGEADGALGLLKLDNYASGIDSGGGEVKKKDISTHSIFLSNDAEGERLLSFVDFQKFDKIVNKLILDSKLSETLRFKYYELCCAQRSYLHAGLLKSISCALAAGIISDTVSIADAIRSCKITTSQYNFALWDKTLAGFALLGMEVGFLRERLNKLVKLAVESGEMPESKRYKQAKIEHNLAEDEIRTLETKHLEMQKMKKVKPTLPRQPVDPSTVRRSSRVAERPPPNYKEVPVEPSGRPRSYSYRRRDLSNRVYASDEDREYAQEKAEKLQSGLDANFPSFVKPMLQSHVTGGFWLGLPVQFCKTYLPKRDETVILVDEEDKEFATKYLALKTGLSAGWRGFSIEHELVDGDAMVFQLIEPTKFKVYIIRVNRAEDSNNS